MNKKMTKEQVLGTKFELWMEQLLKDLAKVYNIRAVRQNVHYHRSRYDFRQVDVEYKDDHPANSLVIMELKYCCRGKIGFPIRAGTKTKNSLQLPNLDNIVRETEERRLFVEARKGILITNSLFTDEVYQEAEQYSAIQVYDWHYLAELDKKRGRGLPLEQQINNVSININNCYRENIYR